MQRESNEFENGSTYTAVLVNGRICDQTEIDWNTEMPINTNRNVNLLVVTNAITIQYRMYWHIWRSHPYVRLPYTSDMPLKIAHHPTRWQPKFQSQSPDLTYWSLRVSQKIFIQFFFFSSGNYRVMGVYWLKITGRKSIKFEEIWKLLYLLQLLTCWLTSYITVNYYNLKTRDVISYIYGNCN